MIAWTASCRTPTVSTGRCSGRCTWLGLRNWWLPGWLDRWLPRLDVHPVDELGSAGTGSGQGVQPAQDHALT